MEIINIIGRADARILVYPLARALSLSGLTAVVTDDGAYRRLYSDTNSNTGTISGVDIIIGLDVENAIKTNINKDSLNYSYVIAVHSCKSDESDSIIIKGVDRTILAENEVEEDRGKKGKEIVNKDVVYVSFEGVPRNSMGIMLREDLIKYVFDCEERKELAVLKDIKVNKIISSVFSNKSGVVEKELLELLKKKEHNKGGKTK